jgi:uncharacterized protein (DUF302 family)
VAYEQAVEQATAALKAQGFGVLTTIDVQQTLKQKLDRSFRKYVILGACNPPLADRALQAELEIGLLLPCNVIVYEVSPGNSVVSAMAPLAALGVDAQAQIINISLAFGLDDILCPYCGRESHSSRSAGCRRKRRTNARRGKSSSGATISTNAAPTVTWRRWSFLPVASDL